MPNAPSSSPGHLLADDDSDLARRARGGDVSAFEHLVQRHRAVVFRVCARIVGVDDAEDVSQEAFLRAFHRLDRFRGEAPFRAWLLRIAHHAALDALAQRQKRAAPVAGDLEDAEPVTDEKSRLPAEALEASERKARLEQKLHLLRPAHRSVLVLRDLEGLPYDEIAELTEQPLGSVKGRIHRARNELIELLRANTYDWELPDGD